MAMYAVDGKSLTAIADAIRDKTGKTDDLTLAQMPTELAKLTDEMQTEIQELREEKEYYKDEVENLNDYIETLEARIEELESGGGGGGGGGGGDKSGAYTADGTFSNMEYTWYEMVVNFENSTVPNFGEDEWDGLILDAQGYDVIVPDAVTDAGCIYCKNIVLPATTTRVGPTDNLEFEKIYIKATTPPELESGAFDEMVYSSDPEQFAKFAIVVDFGCGDVYKSETGWCDYAEKIIEGEMPI